MSDNDSKEITENWKWKMLPSIILGPCYMYEFTKNMSAGTDGPTALITIEYGTNHIQTVPISKLHYFRADQNNNQDIKMFIHQQGAEIWLMHANILLKGQVSVFTLPKFVLKFNSFSIFFNCPILIRHGFTDLALEKVVTTGFAREQKAKHFSTVFRVALMNHQ